MQPRFIISPTGSHASTPSTEPLTNMAEGQPNNVVCSVLWYTGYTGYTRIYWGILWYTVVYCGILWYTVVYYGILGYTVVYVVYCDILWCYLVIWPNVVRCRFFSCPLSPHTHPSRISSHIPHTPPTGLLLQGSSSGHAYKPTDCKGSDPKFSSGHDCARWHVHPEDQVRCLQPALCLLTSGRGIELFNRMVD